MGSSSAVGRSGFASRSGRQGGTVVRMLLGEAARVVGPGLLGGLVAALALSRFLRTLVYEVAPSDPAVVIGSVLLIAAVALLACWLPARRGSAIPPADAMRAD